MKETIHVIGRLRRRWADPYNLPNSTPNLTSKIGREIEITYLTKEKGEQVRYGFPVRVKTLIDSYRLNSSQEAKAVVVERKGEDSLV